MSETSTIINVNTNAVNSLMTNVVVSMPKDSMQAIQDGSGHEEDDQSDRTMNETASKSLSLIQ